MIQKNPELFMLQILLLPITAAVMVQLSCQAYKALVKLIQGDKSWYKALISSGGMPSAHSAFVTAFTAALGYNEGIFSPVFGVALLLSLVVIHDSFRVRGALGAMAQRINALSEKAGLEGKPVEESLGHTPLETLIGVLVGALGGVLFAFLQQTFLTPVLASL
jgi:acid phosphatase family membrane protein YuiD